MTGLQRPAVINPASRVRGTLTLPGDKSISHRYAILAAMAAGSSRIENYSPSLDCQSTLGCIEALGVRASRLGSEVLIESPGWNRLRPPAVVLDAGNSGTCMRLLSGLLAGCRFTSTVSGDDSLSRRPMARILEPLSLMGARIESRDGGRPPLVIQGGTLRGIRYRPPVASAQVKSCVLLAGLCAQGETTLEEIAPSRDHTERALPVFGIEVQRRGLECRVAGPTVPSPAALFVPGDFSAAAFFLVAVMLLSGSQVRLNGVGVNPTRTGLLQLLQQAGASIVQKNLRTVCGEPVCDLLVAHTPGFFNRFPPEIGSEWVPNLIDELPVLAVLGTRLPAGLRIRDAAELRKKESDRIQTTVSNLKKLGVQAEEFEDGLYVPPGQVINGGRIDTMGDHRIAMAFSVAGLAARQPVELDDASCCAISFPNFLEDLRALAGGSADRE